MKIPLTSFQNHLPRRVITGRGTSLNLTEICREHGWQKLFIVSDAGVAGAGLLQKVTRPLAEAQWVAGTFIEVPPEPPIEVVDKIVARITDCGADAVIALGGGSVMDAAKVAALCARHRKAAREFVGIGKAGARGLPTILLPTTAGTGSEATFVAVLTDHANDCKVGVADPLILADIAIVDPALTDGLPPPVAASAGMDALIHALEALIANNSTPIAHALSLEAARRIGRSLEVVCREPQNTAARDDMAVGAHLAGMAFANASCCAVHALAYPLGARHHIPHGVITGCFAGEMMRHNAPVCAAQFAEFSQALGWGSLSPEAFAERLDAVADGIGLRAVLRQTRVPASEIESLATAAVAVRRLMDQNPVEVTVKDATRIYQTVLSIFA